MFVNINIIVYFFRNICFVFVGLVCVGVCIQKLQNNNFRDVRFLELLISMCKYRSQQLCILSGILLFSEVKVVIDMKRYLLQIKLHIVLLHAPSLTEKQVSYFMKMEKKNYFVELKHLNHYSNTLSKLHMRYNI